MNTGNGQVLELILEDGFRQVCISCPTSLVPSAGQYLLAGDGSTSPLPVPLFYTDFAPQGFIASGAVPDSWNPGLELSLRGPLGHGFTLPASARRVGLIAFDEAPARLKGLISPALKQDAAVVLVAHASPDNLPDDVEVHPISAVKEILEWADYIALDVKREQFNQIREHVGKPKDGAGRQERQVLIHTPVPCGGVADCGICAVTLKSGWKLACKDGPVFDWAELEFKLP